VGVLARSRQTLFERPYQDLAAFARNLAVAGRDRLIPPALGLRVG
jgi:hypothetical protein